MYLKPEKGPPFGWSLLIEAIIGSTPQEDPGNEILSNLE